MGLTKGRVLYHNEGPDLGYEGCGPHALPHLDVDELPLDPRGWDEVPYDSGTARPTRAQVERLRRGLPVRVEQTLDLAFTVDCCAGFNPRETAPVGGWARTGAVFRFRARLVIDLVPR